MRTYTSSSGTQKVTKKKKMERSETIVGTNVCSNNERGAYTHCVSCTQTMSILWRDVIISRRCPRRVLCVVHAAQTHGDDNNNDDDHVILGVYLLFDSRRPVPLLILHRTYARPDSVRRRIMLACTSACTDIPLHYSRRRRRPSSNT